MGASQQDDGSIAGNASEASSSSLPRSNANEASSSRSKRGNGRRSKRHVNSALRSLLYGSATAGLMLDSQSRDSEEDDERWAHTTRSRLSRQSPDDDALSTSQSVRSMADSTSTRPSTSTEVTTPDLALDASRSDAAALDTPTSKHDQHYARSRHGREGGAETGAGSSGRHAQERAVGPQTLAAAGVVFVGLTAWILAGKDLARLNMALSGKP